MYLRTTKANTKADGPVEYLQLCQNYYDKNTKRSKTEVVYNFGRKDLVEPVSRHVRNFMLNKS